MKKYFVLLVLFLIPLVNAVGFDLVDKGDYVALMVKNPENLGSSDIIIGYDDSLNIERVEKGNDLGGMFKSNIGGGMISIVFVDTNGINKDGEVAKIYYKGYGNMSIIFSDAYDAENHVELEVENGNLEIKDEGKSTSKEGSNGGMNYIFIVVVVLIALAVVYFVLRKYRGSKNSDKEEKDNEKKEEKVKEENKGKGKNKGKEESKK